MIENIPRSVVIAIQAAARDIENAVQGGAYTPVNIGNLRSTIEKFVTGMVAQAYPKVRSSWIDKDSDPSWTKKAAEEIDIGRLNTVMDEFYKGKGLSEKDIITLKRNNLQSLIGKTKDEFRKINPGLFEAYEGGAAETEPKLPLPSAPNPIESPKEEPVKPGEKMELNKPGEVKKNPEDAEFETGLPA